MHWNSASVLPPVDCPLVIKLNEEVVAVRRPTFVECKGDALVFIREDSGEKIVGRFPWTYP